MSELTVACVLRSGGAYRAEHVAGLQAQVRHFMPGARFVCLSDVPVPCERVALESGWPGWWAKVELFRHFGGRTLYLDLDTVIVDDPAWLVTGRFTMIRNWVYPSLFASGVMSWFGDYSHIARAFEPVAERVIAEYVTREQWGDQAWIAENAGDVRAFPPGAIASYKVHRLNGLKPPKYTTIVAFNGVCPPWDGPAWARRWWPQRGVQSVQSEAAA
jgi:hypothetical protein